MYQKPLIWFGMLVFTNLSIMGFQVRYLALFHLFSVIDGFHGSQWESSQEYLGINEVYQSYILSPTLFI